MFGVFKQLNANDVKITPFEAHKEYSATGSDWASSGVTTSSLYWSPDNKSTFSSESIKYYQLDKLYYRDYIGTRAHRLELDDATYKQQERRLYETASVISIPQYTFGNEAQPGSVTIVTNNKTLKDDKLGNLYDTAVGKDGFPSEDNRVLYIAPVKGFKYTDLTIDPKTGNSIVNIPDAFSGTYYDDSYYRNKVTYDNILFGTGGFELPNSNPDDIGIDTPSILNTSASSKVTIEHRDYFNSNNGDFTISFWLYQSASLQSFKSNATIGDKLYILTKEGLPTTTTSPPNNKYPYKIYIEKISSTLLRMVLERSDGINILKHICSTNIGAPAFDSEFIHYVLQRSDGELKVYINGDFITGITIDTLGFCSNKSDITLFAKKNNNGTYDYGSGEDYLQATPIQQLMIWDKALSSDEVDKVYNSVTGTYSVGNVFYDNGFCVITHPSYQSGSIIDPIQTVTYKNTYPITEYEYQCTVDEDEYNFTNNLTARKNPTLDTDEFADFVTGSNFKPYVTTIGLYDNSNNLLALGKLGQPIKMSEETDTTFVIRFDT